MSRHQYRHRRRCGAPPVGQGLGSRDVQPGATVSGFIVFDVPLSAGTPVTFLAPPRPMGTLIEPPTTVNLRGWPLPVTRYGVIRSGGSHRQETVVTL
jgi:hypothetical protein